MTSGAAPPSDAVRSPFMHRPAQPPRSLIRPDLSAVLDRGADSTVSLVCAPAGFGKSVAVSQWCDNVQRPVAWLTLDSTIDHPRRFVLHLVAAVRRLHPNALDTTSQMASAERFPTIEAIVTELSNELDELDERIVVVLDDYHRITEPLVHSLVGALLEDPPHGLHLVIVSRHDPPLPTATLRAQGRLCELRMNDLAFTADDLATFMSLELGHPVPQSQIAAVHASTEGWPAGARLAAHALRFGGDNAVVGAGFLDRAAQEHLTAEVISRFPHDVRRHLVAASYFDRFSAALLDRVAMSGAGVSPPPCMTGTEFIACIHEHNLFVEQVDEAGEWFCFHHVFARLLSAWRTATEISADSNEVAARRAAAKLFREQGLLDDAIEQVHFAGADDELAAVNV